MREGRDGGRLVRALLLRLSCFKEVSRWREGGREVSTLSFKLSSVKCFSSPR